MHLKIVDKKSSSSAAHIIIGCRALPRRDDRYLALRTMAIALGHGMFAPLMLELRQKSSLVYSAFSGASSWKESGLFYILGAMDSKNTEKVLSKMLSIFSKMHKRGGVL